MKNLLLILFLLFAFVGHTYSQSLHIDSTRFITGNNCCTQIQSAIPTNDGGIFFCGSMNNNPGGIIPSFPDVDGQSNVLVGKVDANKQVSWLKVFGGSNEDFGIAACLAHDGGYAVLSTVSSNDIDVTDHKGANDLWLVRLNADGNVLWKKSYGSTYGEVAISIANTPDDGFIMLGATNGSDGDVPFHYGGLFSLDWLVIKIDSTGTVQWSKNLGSSSDDYDQGAILAIDDAYYLISSTPGKDHDCTDTAWHSGIDTDYDLYIVKIDASGNVVWNRSYGGSSGEAPTYAFYDVRDSTIMIAGTTYSSDYMVPDNYGQNDVWVLKIKKDGGLVWSKAFGTMSQEEGASICAAPGNKYIVNGSTRIGTIGDIDGWIIMLDNSGTMVADKIFGGTDAEIPKSILPFANEYAVTGLSRSTIFTEGVTYGHTAPYINAFISFIDYWPVAVIDLAIGKNKFEVFPNPTNGLMQFILPENEGSGQIIAFNSQGTKICSVPFNIQDKKEMDMGKWPTGIYFVQWQGEDGKVYSAKLVKN